MRVVVYGTGGVGGYFGGRLAQAGEEVVFIARGEHLRAIRDRGLRVDSIKGDFLIQPATAVQDPVEVGQADVILLGVKAWQVPQAADAMRPMVGAATFVVPLQNGVDAPAQLAEVLGKEHVVGGLCRISTMIAAPGHIRHVGIEPYIAFGELDGKASQRCEMLRAAFERAGVLAEVPPNIHAAMWEKFVFIAAIGGVGAVTRMPIGVTRSIAETRQMLLAAMQETVAVAQARGVELPADLVSRTLAVIDSLPPQATASMQRDISQGLPSELDSQNGALVRMGREAVVPTPVHAFIYASLLPQEMHARGEGES
jgi:2-dehydropantoate 2-reductase